MDESTFVSATVCGETTLMLNVIVNGVRIRNIPENIPAPLDEVLQKGYYFVWWNYEDANGTRCREYLGRITHTQDWTSDIRIQFNLTERVTVNGTSQDVLRYSTFFNIICVDETPTSTSTTISTTEDETTSSLNTPTTSVEPMTMDPSVSISRALSVSQTSLITGLVVVSSILAVVTIAVVAKVIIATRRKPTKRPDPENPDESTSSPTNTTVLSTLDTPSPPPSSDDSFASIASSSLEAPSQ